MRGRWRVVPIISVASPVIGGWKYPLGYGKRYSINQGEIFK